MNIIKQSRENLTSYDVYELTQSNAIRSMKDCPDRQLIEVEDFVLYEDMDRNGNDITLLAIMDKHTGDVYASQSQTFRENFEKALEFVQKGEPLYIRVLHGKSRAGRSFINCALVSPKVAEKEKNSLTPFN